MMKRFEILLVVGIILVFVTLNSLPFIAGVLATPSGSVFLGTVHWPGDYFYYLSQFAQGRNSWFTSYDLYTNDFPQKTMVGWVNVFLGHLFSLIGINHFAAYQLSVVIFTASFLLVSYFLIRELYTDYAAGPAAQQPQNQPYKRGPRFWVSPLRVTRCLMAFILFVTSNAFPGYDFWFNNGIPFNRLGGVAHHLIARTVIVLIFLLALRFWRKVYYQSCGRMSINILWFLVLGFILASVEPVHWILVTLILFIVPLFYKFSKFIGLPARIATQSVAGGLGYWVIGLFFFLGGLPMAVYLKRLFVNPPYSQLAAWEASQQVNISLLNFVLANGPVMILAIVGLILLFWNDKVPPCHARVTRFLIVIFPLLTIGLFFSPLPRLINIVNVRFLPAVTTLFLAILAAEAIFSLARSHLARLAMTTAVILIMIPSYYVQIQNRIKTEPANAFFYVKQSVYESFQEAEKISSINDTFLVIWPFNWSFPGITGRRVYEGHSLLTGDYEKKELMTRSFFFGDMSKVDMEKMLRLENINYVLTYPWSNNINELENVEKVFDNKALAIYKVK